MRCAGIEHGVDVNAATIRGQRGQVEAWEVASMKLVEEVCNFLQEVAQLTELAEPHLISAHHLLPSQCPRTNVVTPPASKMVGYLTPALRSGPDIAADAEAAALIRVLQCEKASFVQYAERTFVMTYYYLFLRIIVPVEIVITT